LLRRIHYVLTGLPPAPEQTKSFLEQAGRDLDQAVKDRVDELLESPRFGERWGRHWLDVARYADVTGGTRPRTYREAWRYRDYVIHAFNSGKPFDAFVREQIAGDLLGWQTPQERAANVVATGFLGLAHVLGATRDPEQLKLDGMDEQLDVIGRAFLGIQIGCARCHDHKLDPFPARDYYAMAGILRSTVAGPVKRMGTGPIQGVLPETPETAPVWMRGGDSVKIHGATEAAEIRDEPIHVRGEVHVTGEMVPRGLPGLIDMTDPPAIPANESGRRELAEWLLREDNPLVSRVIVNRIWHHVFGQGIVRSTDNFGFTGDPPSHPELLDDLARRFRSEHDWSFKSMIRELMTSRAFRQSSKVREEGMATDPENRLVWRANPRRMDAEAVIDSIQFVAGRIQLDPATHTVPKFNAGNQTSTSDLEIPPPTLKHRALYWPVFRKDMPIDMDILPIFDFPPATVPRGTRATTSVPSQSLALLNNPEVLDCSRRLSRELSGETRAERLDALFLKLYARHPNQAEQDRLLTFLENFETELNQAEAAKPENSPAVAWARLCHTLLVSNEFLVIP